MKGFHIYRHYYDLQNWNSQICYLVKENDCAFMCRKFPTHQWKSKFQGLSFKIVLYETFSLENEEIGKKVEWKFLISFHKIVYNSMFELDTFLFKTAFLFFHCLNCLMLFFIVICFQHKKNMLNMHTVKENMNRWKYHIFKIACP